MSDPGWGCRRARSAVGGGGGGAGMREDREPAPPPGALARPRMNTIELEREPYSDAYTDSTNAIARGSSRMFGPMRFMT